MVVVITPGWGVGSGNHAGGHHGETMTSHTGAPQAAIEMKNPVKADADSIKAGKELYGQLCSVCHGTNGAGDGPAGHSLSTKPSNLAMMAGQHSPGEFAWVIRKGKGDMPGWEEELEEQEVWDIVNYIRMSLGKGAKSSGLKSDDGHNHSH